MMHLVIFYDPPQNGIACTKQECNRSVISKPALGVPDRIDIVRLKPFQEHNDHDEHQSVATDQ